MTEAPERSERAEQGMNSAAACALKIVRNDFSSFFVHGPCHGEHANDSSLICNLRTLRIFLILNPTMNNKIIHYTVHSYAVHSEDMSEPPPDTVPRPCNGRKYKFDLLQLIPLPLNCTGWD
jgi:hypothetical protein